MAATSITAVASSPIPVETRLVLVRQSIVYNSMSVATQVRSNGRHLVSDVILTCNLYYICVFYTCILYVLVKYTNMPNGTATYYMYCLCMVNI